MDYLLKSLPKEDLYSYVEDIIYERFQVDPVGFGEDVLGETYTEDIKKVFRSIVDNEVTIAKSANSIGKTHVASSISIWFYKCFPNSQVYTLAAPPIDNLINLLWGEIDKKVLKHPALFKNDKYSFLNLSRTKSSFIKGVSIPSSGSPAQQEAKFTGKHSEYILFIIDEADAVPDAVHRGIEANISGGFVRVLYLFNPREERGPIYMKERDGLGNVINLSAFNHPNVITGKDIIPGAVTKNTTVRRLVKWSRPLHENEKEDRDIFIVPNYLVGYEAIDEKRQKLPPLQGGKRKVENHQLSYMVLAKYPSQSEQQLISQDWINKAVSRYDLYVAKYGDIPPKDTIGIIGQDVAEFGTDKNVCCKRYGGYVKFAPFWQGVDTLVTSERCTKEYRNNNIGQANIDGTGVGTGIAPYMMREGCNAYSIKVGSKPDENVRVEEGEFESVRDLIWWKCREWLRVDATAMLPHNEQLHEELRTPTYSKRKNYIKVMNKDNMRKLIRRSPDWADALCLTFMPMKIGGAF